MPPSTTRYVSLYKSQIQLHSRTRWSLKRQRLMSVTFSSTKTIKLPMGEQTVRLPTTIHCYLLTHCLKDGPVAAVIMANVVANVANLMSGVTALRMGKLAIGAKASIISKPFDVPRLLINHAASYWLGLVRVLCDKAPRIKRQVASIDKKSDLNAKSSHFRTSTSNSASSSQKKQTTPKTVTSGKGGIPSPRMHSFEDAKLQAGKKATGVRPGRDVDVSGREQHSQDEASATTGKEPKTSKQGNSVHSGPNKKIMDSVKDGPFSN